MEFQEGEVHTVRVDYIEENLNTFKCRLFIYQYVVLQLTDNFINYNLVKTLRFGGRHFSEEAFDVTLGNSAVYNSFSPLILCE